MDRPRLMTLMYHNVVQADEISGFRSAPRFPIESGFRNSWPTWRHRLEDRSNYKPCSMPWRAPIGAACC